MLFFMDTLSFLNKIKIFNIILVCHKGFMKCSDYQELFRLRLKACRHVVLVIVEVSINAYSDYQDCTVNGI